MQTWWLEFTDGTHGACDGESEYDAKLIAEKLTGKKVAGGQYKDIEAKPLPYPCTTIIWQFEHPIHGKAPNFCSSPRECAGHTSCPKSYSCTE